MNVKLNLAIFCKDKRDKCVIFCYVDKKDYQTRVKTFKNVGLPRLKKKKEQKQGRSFRMLVRSITETNNSLKTDKYITAIPNRVQVHLCIYCFYSLHNV